MNKQRIITGSLIDTRRDGMGDLVSWLRDYGFFTSPASTRFHGHFEGGLAAHSLRVYQLLTELCPDNIDDVLVKGQKPLNVFE